MKLATQNATSWPLLWANLPAAFEPQDARDLLNVVEARDRQMLTALSNVRAAHGLHSARRMQRRYLLSGSAKLAALSRVWQSRVSAIKECTDDQVIELMKMADNLFTWKPAPGRARAWPKAKRDAEGYRIIHKFELQQAAQDKMAANAAGCLANILPTQFNWKGKGIEQFEAWLEELMPKIQVIVTADIPSCFDVIRRNSMEVSLLLPKRVVEATMLIPMDKAKRLPNVLSGIYTKDIHDVETGAAKRSVPQGSALAQLAADIEIDKVLRAVAAVHGSVHVAAFGDNLIFLLEDAGWLGSVKAALTSATTNLFGADVTTALVHRIRCDKPSLFKFCRRTYSWRKGKLRKDLPDGYVDDYVSKMMIRTQDAYALKDQLLLDRCERGIKGFLAQHLKVKGVLNECADLLANVQQYRSLLAKKTLQEPA